MQTRISLLLSGAVLLLLLKTTPSMAQEKVQAFVANGKVVFTNLVQNGPAPAAVPTEATSDLLADEMPEALRTLVDRISANHGVDPGFVRAVMKTESNFNRWARSPKGALGLMQLIPATGRRYGVSDFFDPQQNVEGGVRYLRFLLDKFNGNIDLALAGYNAGENLVERLGRIPAIPETKNYVRKIRAIYKSDFATVVSPSMLAAVKEEAPRIFRVVDHRGVVNFSNIEPPN